MTTNGLSTLGMNPEKKGDSCSIPTTDKIINTVGERGGIKVTPGDESSSHAESHKEEYSEEYIEHWERETLEFYKRSAWKGEHNDSDIWPPGSYKK